MRLTVGTLAFIFFYGFSLNSYADFGNGKAGLLTVGYRTFDTSSPFVQYTVPLNYQSGNGLMIGGPQLGLFNMKERDLFVGYGAFVGYMGTVSMQAGLRMPKNANNKLHLQAGLGFYGHLFLDAESDFRKDHSLHIGFEINLPLGRNPPHFFMRKVRFLDSKPNH